MKKYKIGILALAALGLCSTGASAATIDLYEYAFNVDGAVTTAGVNVGGFNTNTGLGNISFSTSADGAHSFLAFFDHEIDETINTFYNEYGATSGSPVAGQSWEIDEPGWAEEPNYIGNIYDNFLSGTLDSTNGVQQTDDISMAMGWDFFLAADETATITLTLSETAPQSGFYLAHYDSSATGALPTGIYLSSSLNIQGGGDPVPEPATMLLMATGLTGLLGARARRKMKK